MPFGVGTSSTVNTDVFGGTSGILILPARVKRVILTPEEYPDDYRQRGESASLGGIKFEFTNNSTNQNEAKDDFALPYNSNHKNIPQKNEIVTILALPNTESSTNKVSFSYYYLPSVNIWNSPHVNAVPDEALTSQGTPPSQRKNYRDVEQGSSRVLTDKPTTLLFDNNFTERSTVRNIPYFPGDNILEGSFGNHIRLGSTCVRESLPNTWSTKGIGSNGDPIITIQNGQYPTDTSPWEPLSENINLDDSSIYLTSTQKINIEPPTYLNYSYNGENTPEDPDQFTQPQILLNSNRVSLFSRESSLISAPKVHITGETVNMDMTGAFTVYANRVNLGSGNPDELQPALKGDQTQALLDEILFTLKRLVEACATATGTVPIASLQKFALENSTRIQKLNTSTIKSDDTFIV